MAGLQYINTFPFRRTRQNACRLLAVRIMRSQTRASKRRGFAKGIEPMRIANGRWPCPCWFRQITPAAKPSTKRNPSVCMLFKASNPETSFCAEPYMHGTVGSGPMSGNPCSCALGGGITPAWTHHSRPWLCPTCCTASARMCQLLCQPQKHPLQGDAVVP
jgi:hypothetical protein